LQAVATVENQKSPLTWPPRRMSAAFSSPVPTD
jgi:hypothetical protein